MYPSSSCSSHKSSVSMMMSQTGGLTRYGSAPGSLLSTAVGAAEGHLSLSAGSGSRSRESTCKVNCSSSSSSSSGIAGCCCCSSSSLSSSSSSEKLLLRQRSSPAGFLTPHHIHSHTTNANANGILISSLLLCNVQAFITLLLLLLSQF